MLVGETNRGWNSQGSRSFGLERIRWTGRMPFEILKMEARPDGFEITFTEDVDATTAADPASYAMSSYTYIYHEKYGSDETDTHPVRIEKADQGSGKRSLRLHCADLRAGYVHELHLNGIKSSAGTPLVHPEAYYTLNRLPQIGSCPWRPEVPASPCFPGTARFLKKVLGTLNRMPRQDSNSIQRR